MHLLKIEIDSIFKICFLKLFEKLFIFIKLNRLNI